jgi:hypothetical protein
MSLRRDKSASLVKSLTACSKVLLIDLLASR